MSRATVNVIHFAPIATLFLSIANWAECAKQAPMPIAKSSTPVEGDDIEAAADALAAMSMYAEELPDLPEHLQYLVLDTNDGPKVSVVPAEFSEMIQANPELVVQTDGQTEVPVDADVNLVQSSESTVTKVSPQAVVDLNRFNFHDNVLRDGHDQPLHWIVRFCHDWYEPCDQLTPVFKEAAFGVERLLNANDQFQTTVRFADVDCSTNKPLCNEVADYHFPQIIHFHRQARLTDWKGGGNSQRNAQRFLTWVDERKAFIEQEVEFPILLEAETRGTGPDSAIAPVQWDVRHVIAVFILTAGSLAGYFWMLVKGITGMDFPVTCTKTHSTGSNSSPQRSVFTCRDMLPDDWHPSHQESTAVVEL